MSKTNKQTIFATAVVALLVICAASLRIIGRGVDSSDSRSFVIGCFRALIYIGLFSAWGFSLRRRIVQTQARHFFTAISALIVFWVATRTLKFMFFADTHTGRFLWYLYYLPMLFIPPLMFFIALSLGESERFKLPKQTNIVFCISALFVILVLTNDIHQLVFGFPEGLLHFDNGDYTHRIVYYLILFWSALCVITASVSILVKSRVPYSKRRIYLPCIPLLMLVLYTALYLIAPDIIHPIAGDMTVTVCLLTVAILESFIQCGLIQSNTRYALLFESTSIRARISDESYNILLSSADTDQLSKDVMRRTETAPVMLDNGVRLCGASIKTGHVIWSEDISELSELISELADSSEYLSTRRTVLHREVETRKEERHLAEQNRLYNRLMNGNQDGYSLYSELISQLEATSDTEREKKLTAKLAVVCTHIKRRGNLIFLAERGERIDVSELRFALEEWLSNLRLCGVKCTLYSCINLTLNFSQTVALYDTFQQVLLHTLDTLHSLLVTIGEKNNKPCLILNLSCESDFSEITHPNVDISDEGDGEWVITINISKEGTKAWKG